MKTKFLIWSFAAMLLSGMSFTSCSNDDPTDSGTEQNGENGEDTDDENANDENKDDDNNDETSAGITLDTTGSDYYVFLLGDSQFESLGDKVVADFRPEGDGTDDTQKNLYIWGNTYTPGTCTGPNAFGDVEGWTSLVAGSIGWTGAGISIPTTFSSTLAKLKDINDEYEDYVLHVVLKTSQSSWAVSLGLDYGDANSGVVVIGNTSIDNIAPYKDITHDGEWNLVTIPLSKFYETGFTYSKENVTSSNVFHFLSGAVAGTTLDIDACFIYKPAK